MSLKTGSLIRNLDDGRVYPVFMVNSVGIFIVDCYSTENPTPIMVILPRDFKQWKEDIIVTEKKMREFPEIDRAFRETEMKHEINKYYQACL